MILIVTIFVPTCSKKYVPKWMGRIGYKDLSLECGLFVFRTTYSSLLDTERGVVVLCRYYCLPVRTHPIYSEVESIDISRIGRLRLLHSTVRYSPGHSPCVPSLRSVGDPRLSSGSTVDRSFTPGVGMLVFLNLNRLLVHSTLLLEKDIFRDLYLCRSTGKLTSEHRLQSLLLNLFSVDLRTG